MNNFRSFLLELLNVIGYQDDKEVFADQFIKKIQLQSAADLFKSLPQEKQTELEQQLKDVNNPEAAKQILSQNFTEEQIQDSLKNTTQKALTKYIEAISPSLNESQRAAVLDIFQKLNPQSSN